MFHCLMGNRHGVAERKGGEIAEAPLHMSGRDAGPKCKDNPIVLQRDAIVPIGFGPAALGPTRNGLPLRKRFLFQRALWVYSLPPVAPFQYPMRSHKGPRRCASHAVRSGCWRR